MAAGLLLAFIGDVLIGYDFIIGAGTFALGHVCFVAAYCFIQRIGKAIDNFISNRTAVTAIIAVASALFFFSDLMLVFDWFIGRWDWTDHACMGTYYPALCMLAYSIFRKATMKVKNK